MIPKYGPSCDLCSEPAVHYLLRCSKGHEWDEPACPGKFKCPECKRVVTVSSAEHDAFTHDVVGVPR
jgi:hypothetical protein